MSRLPSRRNSALLVIAACLIPACGAGKDGAPGPVGPGTGVVIHSITATPPVLRPGETATIEVSASDPSGGVLTYSWTASAGILASTGGNPVDWTAPGAPGGYSVEVTVSNGAGSTALGIVSLFASVSPSGPVITSVNPRVSYLGGSVRVTGAGFGATQGSSSIAFSGVAGTVTTWTDTEIQASLPGGSGPLEVIVTVAGAPSNPGEVVSAWRYLDPNNVPLVTAANYQSDPQIAPDGAGGAIIVWTDLRSGSGDIYAQRVDAAGSLLWATDGVAISAAAGTQAVPQIVPDLGGGAIISWQDNRPGGNGTDIYAQRVDSAGATVWATDGVLVCGAVQNQSLPRICPDGGGGAVIAWEDLRSLATLDLYAQRVNGNGAVLWTADGVPVTTAASNQTGLRIVADDSGGAVLAWVDPRSGANDIYAQRLNGSGIPLWAVDGRPVCTATQDQSEPQIVSDGAGGAVIAWRDRRNEPSLGDIYAQRLDGLGALAWMVNGVPVSTAFGSQSSPQLAADGSGAVTIVWTDARIDAGDIYAQRLDGDGLPLWSAGGMPVSTQAGTQANPQIIPGTAGNVIIAWEDARAGWDIYAQRLDAAGLAVWTAHGIAIATASGSQGNPRLTGDAAGGAIVTWQDERAGNFVTDVYAQGVTSTGNR